MRKIILILAMLAMLASSAMAGTCTITETSGIDYTSGKNITLTCAGSDINTTKCFSKGSYLDGGVGAIDYNDTGGDVTYGIWVTPEHNSEVTIGCENNIDCYCFNDTSAGTHTSEFMTDSCTESRICIWDYETADLDDVIADNIGTAGIATRDYMPLIILGVIALILGAMGTAVYMKYKKQGRT